MSDLENNSPVPVEEKLEAIENQPNGDDNDRLATNDESQDDFDKSFDEEDNNEEYDEENIYAMKSHKLSGDSAASTKKKKIRKTAREETPVDKSEVFVAVNDDIEDYHESKLIDYSNEDPASRKRRLLEEKMTLALKSKSTRTRKADEDDLERMQDDKIDFLKNKMIEAANLDVEKNSQGQIATEKLKLLNEVTNILSKADLAISILDNNLLEAVRLWLEPLPDASMPAYQIQKELIHSLESLPIKTDHLIASGIGKVLVFYQRSQRTEPNLKKIVDRLIGDWTRPILNKSDSYKDRTIQFHEYNKNKFTNQLSSARRQKPKEAKTLYEESAERRNRAAIPSARTTAYKIAPKVDASLLRRQNARGTDERFKKINQKLTLMSFKKKATKKGGPSIEGRNLAM